MSFETVSPAAALDPTVMLAAGVQAQPGVYALLLGSGVSTGARIPDGASWVVGSGSLPQGVGPDFYATLGNRVRDAGARFALDSSGPALTAGLAARPHLIKPNIDELAEAVGRPISRLGDAVAAGQELVQRGAGCVVVSLGPDGALLIDGTQAVHAETHVARPP